MKPLSKRTDGLSQSDIRAVSMMVDKVGGINLGQGICDLPTPAPLRESARDAIEANRSTYSNYAGVFELRRFVLEKARSFNRIPVSSESEVIISVGSTGAFATAMLALLDPGDEVILFEPFYGYHRNIILAVGGTPVAVPQQDETWEVDYDLLRAKLTPDTKAVVVTTPGNPHGKVWSERELQALLDLAMQRDVYVVTDEIYEYITYDGRSHVSVASLPNAYERTITISGFSKTYNMTGWRLGYAVARPPVIEKMGLLNDLFYICAPTPLQYGVAAAAQLAPGYYDRMRSDYEAKRRLMCETLEAIGFQVPWPQGAYYTLASLSPLRGVVPGFEDDREACNTLISRCGVGSVCGSSFFSTPGAGLHYLRFCFAKEMPELQSACDRLLDRFG